MEVHFFNYCCIATALTQSINCVFQFFPICIVRLTAGGSLTATIETMKDFAVDPKLQPCVTVKDALFGERRHAWLVSVPSPDGGASEVALPEWTTDGIDSTISKWVAEHEKWEAEISARHAQGKALTHKKKLLHDAFVSTSVRKCPHANRVHVFDQSTV